MHFAIYLTSLLLVGYGADAATKDCSAAKIAEIVAPATVAQPSVVVNCSATLPKKSVLTKKMIFRGAASSGAVLDCNGSTLKEGNINKGGEILTVVSRKLEVNGSTVWERPENITIKNCTINGSVRIIGLGRNGEAPEVRASSRSLGHTERAQAAAPRNIQFENVTINGTGRIPLYFAPGVTYSGLRNSTVAGVSRSTAIYMDAESGHNKLKNNRIVTDTGRELVAVDGSANNLIVGNYFSSLEDGGIYLYRNCGEGGTVRHQTPSRNRIINNTFYYKKYKGANPAVFLGSRQGHRSYCGADRGFNFGSSINDRDFANHNIVAYNQFFKFSPGQIIRSGGDSNLLRANQTVTERIHRASACYVRDAYPSSFIPSGSSVQHYVTPGGVVCAEKKKTCRDGEITHSKANCGERPTAKGN